MRLSDSIEVKIVVQGIDAELNEVELEEWKPLGRCCIFPNTAANVTKTNDGKEYVYSYEVVMKKPKTVIPKDNDIIHIVKSDGTIDAEYRVRGFVTLRNWLKLWV